MKRANPLLLSGLLLASFISSSAQSVWWTGRGNGWLDQNLPTGSGTEILIFGDTISTAVDLSGLGGSVNLDAIVFNDGDPYRLNAGSPLTLTITNGVYSNSTSFHYQVLGANLTLSLAGTPVISGGGNDSLVFSGLITGSPTSLTLEDTVVFNGAAANTYTGTTILANNANFAAWGPSPFGSGPVIFQGNADFSVHGNQTISNNLTFSSTGVGTVALRSWDAPLTFSGAVTLANNTQFAPLLAPGNIEFSEKTGSLPMPGAPTRNPIVFTGNIGQSGGARSLTISNPGIVILKPTSGSNTYTGGTVVNGTVIFGNNGALPASGVIQVGTAGVNPTAGYAGLGDLSTGNFALFLSKLSNTSAGSVGVDTLPGNATVTFTENISLTGFATDAIRLGTATSAILTGVITPRGTDYHFGNGGGTLYVQSNLNNVSTTTHLVMNNNNNVPLKLFLQGGVGYSGNTYANNGFIVFDGSALPSTGFLRAGGGSTVVGSSYIGMSDTVSSSVAAYLAKFDKPETWGTIGFDSHSSGSPFAVGSPIDLTGFNNGVFLGTATSAILNGAITPSTVTNANQTANTLRFTAANGGTLTVNTALADQGPPLAVVLGAPQANDAYTNGTVILNGANTYTGGTTFNASGLIATVGSSSAFGTGAITLVDTGNGLFGLQGATALEVANDIAIPLNTALHLMGGPTLTLSGDLSGAGSLYLERNVGDPMGDAILSGNNLGFTGAFGLQASVLTLTSNEAAGHADISLFDDSSTLAFSGPATAPTLYGLSAAAGGKLILPNGTTLTLDTSDDSQGHNFNGVISGPGGSATSAALVVTSVAGGEGFVLAGNNLYSGGTTITNHGLLAVMNGQAVGTGPVTLNSSSAALVLGNNVTFTNQLNYTAGTLAGYGTFSPSNLNPVTFGSGQKVRPGAEGNPFATGKLSFTTDMVFAPGGGYVWSLQDATSLEGAGSVSITGNLDLASLTAASFNINLLSLGEDGEIGATTLIVGNNYSFTLLTTAGTITGFEAGDFLIDPTDFQNGTMLAAAFSITADSQNLYLNFQAIPEPQTWALLAAGAILAGLARRRRST